MNGAPKIAANATAILLCSSSTAGVGARLLLGQRSDSDVRLQAAANRGGSKHFDDARNRGIVGRPTRPSPRYTVIDHRTMRTFGAMRDGALAAVGDLRWCLRDLARNCDTTSPGKRRDVSRAQ